MLGPPTHLIALVAAYFVTAEAGLALADAHDSITAVWPATGVAIAALYLGGIRLWPAVALGALLVNLTTGAPLESVAGITVGNTLEAVVAAALLRRAEFDPALARMRDVVTFLWLAAVLGTMISAFVGVGSLWLGGELAVEALNEAWWTWWLGDLAGAILVGAPLILLGSRRPRVRLSRPTWEFALALLGVLAVAALVFAQDAPLAYVALPPAALMAMRFQQMGAAAAALMVAAVGVYFTARGLGPFAAASPDEALVSSQLFAVTVAVSALLLAAVRTELLSSESERKAAALIAESATRMAEAQEVARFGSWDWNPRTGALQWSDALFGIFGCERGSFTPSFDAYLDLVHPEDRERVGSAIAAAVDALEPFSFEDRIVRPDGDVRLLRSQGRPVVDEDGHVARVVGVCQDITELRRAEQAKHEVEERFQGELRHLAYHDPLTGLANRRFLLETLDQQVAYHSRYGGHGAALVMDLDQLKYVNDTLGHGVGDEIIGRVATLLRERLRRTDVVGRLGGDEFGIILPHTDAVRAREVAEELLEAIRTRVVVASKGRRTRMTASVGIALFGQHDELTGEMVLVNADIAMYEAKASGRDRVALVEGVDEPRTQMEARLNWLECIRAALKEDRFVLYGQPIVALNGDGPPRYELLLRMVGEDGEHVPPAAFLGVAEEFGLIQAIDVWVVRRAVALSAEWARAGQPVLLEVNLSGASMTDTAVLGEIESEITRSGVDPRSLIFEVTETAAIVNIEEASRFARRLCDLGCAFALDDFGAGFGSFYYLKHLPFDHLKIDGDFIRDLPNSQTDQLTVKAIVEIARGLGRTTIAEFVEDQATFDLLREYGVDYAQGFHLGRPMPMSTLGHADPWPRIRRLVGPRSPSNVRH